ncbi:MAG: 3-hydroxyacyl-CoA dehydrogenase family protein, partial [Oscillospiraceae bacterium]|nr:3-hydroxyacyl-CoA dehydrogenase family protein [Oscillospiraceae bacterium]
KEILFRTVVPVKDLPGFLGNRIGFQFINQAMRLAGQYQEKGGIDYIDALLGGFTGRAMAPLLTANFVGLDIHKAIVDNLLEKTCDYAHDSFVLPDYAEEMVGRGDLGRKTGCGLYKTALTPEGKKRYLVYDIAAGDYRDQRRYDFPFVRQMKEALRNGQYRRAFSALTGDSSPEAELCAASLLHYILYARQATAEVGLDEQAGDHVMATGFNWCPPLAMIEAFGGPEAAWKLAEQRLPPALLRQTGADRLIGGAPPSAYDYRRYFRAKG